MADQCTVYRLGLIRYVEAWGLQKRLAVERATGVRPDCLLLHEHPHTYTLGRSGQVENLLFSEAELRQRDIEVHWVDRGGDITYHGPGQLVVYPILALGKPVNEHGCIPQADYVGYVRNLEDVLIRTLAYFGVVAGQLTGLTGVWVQPDIASRCPRCPPAARRAPTKIAAIGVKVDQNGISQHGVALNVNPDMTYFNGIIACGLRECESISMADLCSEPPSLLAVGGVLAAEFGRVFEREMVEGMLPICNRHPGRFALKMKVSAT